MKSPPWPWPSPRSRARREAPPPPRTVVTPSKLVSSTIVALLTPALGRYLQLATSWPPLRTQARHVDTGKFLELVRTGSPTVLGDVVPHLGPVREFAEVHAVLLRPPELVEGRQGADGLRSG